MSLSLSNRSTFAFRGNTYAATAVSVDAPTAEVVNMTGPSDAKDAVFVVPTGGVTAPGRIAVEAFGFANPKDLIGKLGQATFTTPRGSFTHQAVCESAAIEGRVADLLRIRFSLLMTSYTE